MAEDDGGVDQPKAGEVAMDAVTFGRALDAFRPMDVLTPPGAGNAPPPRCPMCESFLHPVRQNEKGDTLFECLNDHEAAGLSRLQYECVYDLALRAFRSPRKPPWWEERQGQWVDLKLWMQPRLTARGQAKPETPTRRGRKRPTAGTETPAPPTPSVPLVQISEEIRAALKTLGMTEAEYMAKLAAQQPAHTVTAAETTPAGPAIPRRRGAGKPKAPTPSAPASVGEPATLSLRAASNLSGVPRATLMGMIARGEVAGATKGDTGWLIPEAPIRALMDKR